MSAVAEYKKPLPLITLLNKPYWDAAKRHELRMQRCQDCGRMVWPISTQCQACWSNKLDWVRLSGKGRLSSWAVYHQAFNPVYANDVPYNVAEVELEEGPRLVTNIVGADPKQFSQHMPVEVFFDDVTPEVTLLKFRPAREVRD